MSIAQRAQSLRPARLTPLRTVAGPGSRPLYLAVKRGFDLVVGCVLLLLMAPLFALVALLVKLSSPGPTFFRQERVGKDGRPFTMTKFRSMYHGVDATAHHQYFQQYLRGVPAPNEKSTVFKMHSDSRITPVGRHLRRLGLDELPQLLHVIKGEMSLVGPRPPLAYEVELYEERHKQRLLAKPGVTGLWQVRGRDVVNFESMVDMDLEYIRNMSLWLDLRILLLTGPSLLWAFMTK